MGASRHHFEFGAALGAKLVEAREKLAAVLSEQFAELEDILIVEYAHSLEAALAEAAASRKASEEEKDFEQQRAAAVEEARKEAAEKERALEQQRAAEAESRRKAAEEALELERQRAKAEEEAKEKREKEAARLRELELDRQKEEEKEEKARKAREEAKRAEEEGRQKAEEEKARKAREEAKRAEEEGRQKAEEMRKKGLDALEAKRKAADKEAKEAARKEDFMGRFKESLQEHARQDAGAKAEAVIGRPEAEEGLKPVVAVPSAVQADTAQRKKEEPQENGPTTARSEVPKAPTAAAPLPEGGQGLGGAGLQGRLQKELADSRKKLEERSQGKEERQAAPPQESDPASADAFKARLQKELTENLKKLEENPRRVGGIVFPAKKISDAATVSAEQAFEKLASRATLTADEVALLNSVEPSKLSERLVEDCRPHVEDQDPEGFGRMWIVIGGIGKGGIVVRRSEDKGSPNLPARLVPGARIEELDLRGNRLHYRRIRGDGPNFGWINVEFDGRKLVVLETS